MLAQTSLQEETRSYMIFLYVFAKRFERVWIQIICMYCNSPTGLSAYKSIDFRVEIALFLFYIIPSFLLVIRINKPKLSLPYAYFIAAGTANGPTPHIISTSTSPFCINPTKRLCSCLKQKSCVLSHLLLAITSSCVSGRWQAQFPCVFRCTRVYSLVSLRQIIFLIPLLPTQLTVDNRLFQYTFRQSNVNTHPCSRTVAQVSSLPASTSMVKTRYSFEICPIWCSRKT